MKIKIERLQKIAYHIMFFAMLVIPIPLYFVVRGKLDHENYEYRTLAAFPDIRETGYTGFAKAFENWFSDHQPYKNELVEFGSYVKFYVFRTPSDPTVIIGKNNWLFFKGVDPDDPIAYYQGNNLLTDEELEALAVSLNAADKELEARGCDFVLFLTPEKERMYPQYMPDIYGEPAEKCRYFQIAEYLREHTDIPVILAYDSLKPYMDSHPDEQTYLKYDTHWNEAGAYIGSTEIAEYLGHPLPYYDDINVSIENYPQENLGRLLHLQDTFNDDHSRVLSGYGESEYKYDPASGDMHFYNSEGTDERKIMLIGDSYRLFMQKYALRDFKTGYSDYYYNYTHDVLEQEQPDIFIYESHEYALSHLSDFFP